MKTIITILAVMLFSCNGGSDSESFTEYRLDSVQTKYGYVYAGPCLVKVSDTLLYWSGGEIMETKIIERP